MPSFLRCLKTRIKNSQEDDHTRSSVLCERGVLQVIAHVSDEQSILVDLLRAIKVLPTDTLMQTIRQVIKQPPPTNQDKNKVFFAHQHAVLWENAYFLNYG